ncbi:alpha/beta fold hydrolase [Algiphilus sp.]|uniref:alpha/beta hydrolase n=1 Tax=Algiphilus sp. TaxID=1872431 RepID=UPI0025BAD591|nr:alpha/beta fold hydrolase [Algiphilus sp.]MCK5771764.1 alpha/beta fold hydrolase [Algiphilus sp.]
MPTSKRTDTAFTSDNITCRAWLYTPADADGAAIVMAHGLGGTRDAGLEPFAERFADNGYTVLLFDYRHFGASDGEPRQLLSIKRQLADWKAAVAHARGLPGVDPDRIGLWGTSFSGGHVLTTAAQDDRIAAASAQGPMVDGLAAALNVVSYAGVGQLARVSARAIVDQGRGLLGLSPVTIPLAGAPGELAAMSSHDALDYTRITPPDWRNEMTARMMLYLAAYRPIASARKLRCPVLIQACTRDSVAPASAAEKLARRAGPNVTLKQYDIGHFDIYLGEARETALADQLAFFGSALR